MDGLGESRIPRRRFLGTMALGGLPASGLLRREDFRAATADFPRNDLARVQSVVGASHGNFERVRELVLEQPALAKSSWDWGFGDWETPLGAASHTGRREIAEFLIDHGARPTIFSAAMMGDLPTVRAFLAVDRDLHRLHGPHGISLLRHARAGGERAQPVVDHLVDAFGPDEGPFGFAGDAAADARYGGSYAFQGQTAFRITVGVRNDWLMIGTGEEPNSRVLEVGEDVFHPTGAPAVRLHFEVRDGSAVALTIEDGPIRLTGSRTGR